MKTRLLQLAFTFALVLGVTVALSRAQTPAHLDVGQDLVDEIVAAQSQGFIYKPNTSPAVAYNRYGGSWNSPTDPSFYKLANLGAGIQAENNTTCAPLVTHLLKNVYGWSWSSVSFTDPLNNNKVTTSASPSPYRYVALMKQQKGFPDGPVTSFSQIKPGYIFSIWEPGLAVQDHDHTGVVVSVAAPGIAYPADASANPAFVGLLLMPVTMLDSTSDPHGAGDTRVFTYNNAAYTITGAGTGTMGVFVDANGAILGHTWSLPSANPDTDPALWITQFNARYRPQAQREIVFARHVKQPAN